MNQPDRKWHTQESVHASLEICRWITRKHAKSFYFSSFPLPAYRKNAAFAVYAFCRWVDDVIDESTDKNPPTQEEITGELHRIHEGRSDLPIAPAFAEANQQFGIPLQVYEDLIEGCCMDRVPIRIQTTEELELYCYHVAGTVGLMMARIFGLTDLAGAQHAIELGLAMQLTNILRDIQEDYAKGRIYLPLEEMERFGIGPETIATEACNERWKKFMEHQILRARQWYGDSYAGIAYLTPDGSRLATAVMNRVYAGILDEIEKVDYQVFDRRVYVPMYRKVGLALAAF